VKEEKKEKKKDKDEFPKQLEKMNRIELLQEKVKVLDTIVALKKRLVVISVLYNNIVYDKGGEK